MGGKILLGRNREILEIPEDTWKQHLAHVPQHTQSRLSFITDAHHQVRYFVVEELVKAQQPVEPELISEALKMPLEAVEPILDELERNLFFLVRDDHGAVAWAYPVTVEVTAHKLIFNSGERLYAA